MQLTREEDYAFRTMLEIAALEPAGAAATTALVSRRRLIPRAFARKIVPRLVRAGLLTSRRGHNGGLTLARAAEEITLLQVIDAVRPDAIAINRCVLRPESCPLQPICPVHEVCVRLRDTTVQLLGSIRLADMVSRGAELKRRRAAGEDRDPERRAERRSIRPPSDARRAHSRVRSGGSSPMHDV